MFHGADDVIETPFSVPNACRAAVSLGASQQKTKEFAHSQRPRPEVLGQRSGVTELGISRKVALIGVDFQSNAVFA